jgi:hypothetical protein
MVEQYVKQREYQLSLKSDQLTVYIDGKGKTKTTKKRKWQGQPNQSNILSDKGVLSCSEDVSLWNIYS